MIDLNPLKDDTRHKKCSFLLNISSVNGTAETADLVAFTEEILNGKLHFLCRGSTLSYIKSITIWM